MEDPWPLSQPQIRALHTDELIRVGVSRPAESKQLVRLRRGAYLPERDWATADGLVRYLAFLRATARYLSESPVLSHASAAAVWGIPVLGPWPRVLHQVVPETVARQSRFVVRHRRAQMPEVRVAGGFRVTTPPRTVADVATTGFAGGLIAADHALRHGLCSRQELEAEAGRLAGARGARVVREVVAHANPRSESVGESLSRAGMIVSGLALPELQHDVVGPEGLIGRSDFYWPDIGLVGEFDGRVKYGRAIQGQVLPEDVVWAEKQREDRIRDLGIGVVRWTWATALERDRLVRHLRARGVPYRDRRRRRSPDSSLSGVDREPI